MNKAISNNEELLYYYTFFIIIYYHTNVLNGSNVHVLKVLTHSHTENTEFPEVIA